MSTQAAAPSTQASPSIAAIVSVTDNWAIGKDNNLVVRNADDLRRFKELTTGGRVVMGRKTFLSLPHGALPQRTNIVITHDQSFSAPNVIVVHSLSEALEQLDSTQTNWIIGGQSIYEEFLDYCNAVYVTKNHVIVSKADNYFPNLDTNDEWYMEEKQGRGVTKAGIAFDYLVYKPGLIHI